MSAVAPIDAPQTGEIQGDPVQARPAEARAPQAAPLEGATLWITAVALALGTFMQILDGSIANVSLPTIAGSLGVSSDQGTWIVTSFAVANGISVPLTGWLMQRFGVVRTFVGSVILFSVASFLCGAAWSLTSIVGFRVLQGLVSGPLIPGSQALLVTIFPPNKRATGLAVWSMTALVAPVCGPILGGYISDNIAWRWIFYINIPVGVLCAWLCWRGLKTRETPTRKLPVDVVGLVLLAVWVGALQVMLDTGKDADWFSSPLVVALTIVAVVVFCAWLIWETTAASPIVDLSLFKSRNFALGVLGLSVSYAVFFGGNLLLPLWLQSNLGYIATWAGLVAAPSGLVALVLTPFAARFTSRIDPRINATVSMLIFALAFWLRSRYSPEGDFLSFVLPALVQGVAMSVFFVAFLNIYLADVPPEKMPAASGLSSFARITAGGMAASIVTTLWGRREALHQTRLADSSADAPFQGALQALQQAGLSGGQALGLLARQVENQAYAMASVELFRASAVLLVVLIPTIWLTRRPVATSAEPAGE